MKAEIWENWISINTRVHINKEQNIDIADADTSFSAITLQSQSPLIQLKLVYHLLTILQIAPHIDMYFKNKKL